MNVDWVVLIGCGLNIAGSAVYIKDVLAGRTRPNLVTFVLWAAAPLIAATAAFLDGIGWAAVPVLVAGLLPLSICAAALISKQALWCLRPFDYACGAFSLLTLILWAVTHDAALAILFAIISDALAAVPTLRKSWTNPETETPIAYVASAIAAATSFFAAGTYSFTAIGFSAYLVFISLLFVALFTRPRMAAISLLLSRRSGVRGHKNP